MSLTKHNLFSSFRCRSSNLIKVTETGIKIVKLNKGQNHAKFHGFHTNNFGRENRSVRKKVIISGKMSLSFLVNKQQNCTYWVCRLVPLRNSGAKSKIHWTRTYPEEKKKKLSLSTVWHRCNLERG